MNSLLAERIHILRKSKGLTQADVADQIGVSRQRYARMEKGLAHIHMGILSQIAECFGVAVRDITRVLDEATAVEYRGDSDGSSVQDIFDMIDLFYANKGLHDRLIYVDSKGRGEV